MSSFVYAVPPFLAYYRVVSQNQTLLQAADGQRALDYRYVLTLSQCTTPAF